MKTPNSKMLFVLGALLWVASSCQKDNSLVTNGTPNTGSDGFEKTAVFQHLLNDMYDIIDDAYSNNAVASKTSGENSTAVVLGTCGSITMDTISHPRVITIDFGPTNCKGNDGHLRRGKVIATFTGAYRDPGTVITYTTKDFYLDNNKIEVSRIIKTLASIPDVNTHLHFSISDNIKITLVFGLGTITEISEIDREWIEGEATMSSSDDVYLLRGYHNTSFSNGEHFESEIKEALRKENSYPFYITGLEKVDSKNGLDYMVNYSYPNGGHDDLALVTYSNGQTQVMHLK